MRILTTVLLLLGLVGKAQELPIDSTSNRYCFSGIIEVTDASSSELFNRAKKWAVESYNSPKKAIEIEDRIIGNLLIKGAVEVTAKALGIEKPFGYVEYNLSIDVKDGRYRYKLSNFYYQPSDCHGAPLEEKVFCLTKKQLEYTKQQVNEHCLLILASFNENMKKDLKEEAW